MVAPGISSFVERLTGLEKAETAILRRNAGETLATSRNALGLFYRLLPYGVPENIEELYFLVSTLHAVNHEFSHSGDFGTTMAKLNARTKSDSIDRRMALLLDSDLGLYGGSHSTGGEMAYRLRQLVKLAASKEVGVDWERLLEDLTWWDHPNRRARKRWARSYFGANVPEPPDTSQNPTGGD